MSKSTLSRIPSESKSDGQALMFNAEESKISVNSPEQLTYALIL